MSLQIFEAIRLEDKATVVKLLQEQPQLALAKDTRNSTPLLLATYYGLKEISCHIINFNPVIDARDNSGNTSLMGVCFKGHKELVQILLNAGADVNKRNYSNATALHFATSFGHIDITLNPQVIYLDSLF